MQDIINLLPDSVANQIAAGEVVQRPASVIKELLENSIDAGAKRIEVNVSSAGKSLIQIDDDGCGMSISDARLCFERHATSKIRAANDLASIATMGFRGEALASIAAVAEVALETRQEGSDTGTRVVLAGSRLVEQRPVMCSTGASFAVRNLFFNVPARRRFLKSDSVELKHIVSEFQRIALPHPEVAFTLRSDTQTLYQLPAGNTLQRIRFLFGARVERELLPLDVDTPIVRIRGFVGTPKSSMKRALDQFLFVNTRFMRNAYLNRAIYKAYEQLIPTDCTPIFFLFIEVAPERIDVNIHPQKTEVKFVDDQAIWQILHSAVRESLGKHGGIPAIDFGVPPPTTRDLYPDTSPFALSSYERQALAKYGGEGGEGFPPLPPFTPELTQASMLPLATDQRSTLEGPFLPLWGRFIICRRGGEAIVVNQRSAHMRILYERYNNQENNRIIARPLVFPVTLDLPVQLAPLRDSFGDSIAPLGFTVEPEGDLGLIVRSVPSILEMGVEAESVRAMLEAYAEGEASLGDDIAETFARTAAIASAIPEGHQLSDLEAEALIRALFDSNEPRIDPKGHTIYAPLPQALLQNLFER